MIGDAVLQPLESRIRILKDMLDLLQDREGIRSDFVYHEKSVTTTHFHKFANRHVSCFMLRNSSHVQDAQKAPSPRWSRKNRLEYIRWAAYCLTCEWLIVGNHPTSNCAAYTADRLLHEGNWRIMDAAGALHRRGLRTGKWNDQTSLYYTTACAILSSTAFFMSTIKRQATFWGMFISRDEQTWLTVLIG